MNYLNTLQHLLDLREWFSVRIWPHMLVTKHGEHTYAGSGVDMSSSGKQQTSTVDMVALSTHV